VYWQARARCRRDSGLACARRLGLAFGQALAGANGTPSSRQVFPQERNCCFAASELLRGPTTTPKRLLGGEILILQSSRMDTTNPEQLSAHIRNDVILVEVGKLSLVL